jgi:phage gp36-like protein
MSEFVNKVDYPQSIHVDILDALTRDDDTTLEMVEDRDIALMRGYLSGRYDVDALFAARGDDRNKVVLGVLLDIVIYDVFSIHNPQKMSQIRKDRYDRAIAWLVSVQKGDIIIDGAPTIEEDKQDSSWLSKSRPRRDYYF